MDSWGPFELLVGFKPWLSTISAYKFHTLDIKNIIVIMKNVTKDF